MPDRVRIDVIDHVAHVRLVRTDKMNALDRAMFVALVEAGAALRDDPVVRAVVLSGDGSCFCAGIDLSSLAETGERARTLTDLRSRQYDGMNIAQYAVLQWRQVPVPVIAAVQDVAFGGGFQLILGADMRFVAPKARLSIREIHWGLIPDMGGMFLLRDLVRRDVAAELITSGRIFMGEEAQRLGLATRVCKDPVAEAIALAEEIAGRSPDAVRAAKRLLAVHDDVHRNRILEAETTEQLALLGSGNHAEALRAGLAKLKPAFGPPSPSCLGN